MYRSTVDVSNFLFMCKNKIDVPIRTHSLTTFDNIDDLGSKFLIASISLLKSNLPSGPICLKKFFYKFTLTLSLFIFLFTRLNYLLYLIFFANKRRCTFLYDRLDQNGLLRKKFKNESLLFVKIFFQLFYLLSVRPDFLAHSFKKIDSLSVSFRGWFFRATSALCINN